MEEYICVICCGSHITFGFGQDSLNAMNSVNVIYRQLKYPTPMNMVKGVMRNPRDTLTLRTGTCGGGRGGGT